MERLQNDYRSSKYSPPLMGLSARDSTAMGVTGPLRCIFQKALLKSAACEGHFWLVHRKPSVCNLPLLRSRVAEIIHGPQMQSGINLNPTYDDVLLACFSPVGEGIPSKHTVHSLLRNALS
jgi:hypothetical protein